MRNPCSKHPLNRAMSQVRWIRTGLIGIAMYAAAVPGYAQNNDSLFFADESVCPKDVIDLPKIILDAHGSDPSTQEIVLESDQIESPDGDTLILRGNAHVMQGPQAIFGETIHYNKSSYSLNATENVRLITPNGDKLNMDSLNLEMETLIGDAEQVDFQLAASKSKKPKRRVRDSDGFRMGSDLQGLSSPLVDDSEVDDNGEMAEESGKKKDKKGKKAKQKGVSEIRADLRGEADRVFFEGHHRQRMEGVALTSCPEGQDSVFVKASSVVLDHATGVGIGTNMTVRFFGVPIWYFPKASFPINDERKTGFLFPSVGHSDRSGMVLEVPYYINIAPDKDASIDLKYMADRGAQLRGEFRYLGETYDGIFRAEYMPSDDLYDGDSRSAWSYQHTQRIGTGWEAEVNLQDVSDADYTDDFRNNLNISGSSFLRQRARARYRSSQVRFEARVQDYVTADPDIEEDNQPYALLPSLSLNAKTPRNFADGRVEVGVDSSFTSFDHPGDRVTGTRAVVTPYVQAPFKAIYGYVTPRLSVVNNSYSLDNTEPGEEDSPSFSVPIFSVDAGIAFERDMSWGGRPHYQTLEPRVYYVYAPEEDQDDAPVFDTGGGDSNSTGNFYRDNRFFGKDRVGDANRLTIGVSSRIIDNDSGEQRMRAEIAQMFHFDDREVQLNPDEEAETEDLSDLIASITGNFTPGWEAGASVRYSHEEGEATSFRLYSKYQKDARRRVDLNYTWNNLDAEQVDVTAYWPLGDRWQLLLSERYDLEDGESRNSTLALAYDACCWALRFSADERVRRDTEKEMQYYLTLELKNLGKISTAQ